MMEKIKPKLNTILNPLFAQVGFLSIILFTELPAITDHINPLIKFFIFWSLVVSLYHIKPILSLIKKDKLILALTVFAVFYGLAAVINYQSNFRANVIEFLLFSSIIGASLASVTRLKKPQQIFKNIFAINTVAVTIITFVSIAALVAFSVNFGLKLVDLDGFSDIMVGFAGGRLTGFFRNASYASAVLGFSMAAFNLLFLKYQPKPYAASTTARLTVLFWVGLVANLLHVVLQNSNAIEIAFSVAIGFFFMFVYRQKLYKANSKQKSLPTKSWAKLAVASVLVIGLSFFAIGKASQGLVLTRNFILTSTVADDVRQDEIEDIEDDLERSENAAHRGASNGRVELAILGLEAFKEKPVFGHSTVPAEGYVIIDDIKEKVLHHHNLLVHSLYAVGLVGTLAFALVGIRLAMAMLEYLFTKRPKNFNSYILVLALSTFLVFSFVNNMGDLSIIYVTKSLGVVFWYYAIYLNFFLGENKHAQN